MSNTTSVTVACNDTGNVSAEYNDHTINPHDVTPTGIAYLIQYGFAQSLQDSVAGRYKALTDALAVVESEDAKPEDVSKARAKISAAEEVAGTTFDDDGFRDAYESALMAARVKAIMDGTVGTGRSGPRVVGIEKIMRDVALERIKAGAAKNKVALPKKAQELGLLVDKVLAKHGMSIKAEAERRMATSVIDLAYLGI